MSNINEEYIEYYIRNIIPEHKGLLKDIEEYAEYNHIPIIEREVAQLLKVILKMSKPKKILEIGTAIGYSAIVMADSTESDCNITTIEKRMDMVGIAKENIRKTIYENRIDVIQGEAENIIPNLTDKYGLIFIDAAKGQYLTLFNKCTKVLEVGGTIVSDNVLYKGMVATDSLVNRRKKTIVKRLREYLNHIIDLDGYQSCIVPIGDGIALTYKEE